MVSQFIYHGVGYVPAQGGGLRHGNRHHGGSGRWLPAGQVCRAPVADYGQLFDPLYHRRQRLSFVAAYQRPARSRAEKGGINRMSLYCSIGSTDTDLTPQQLNDLLVEGLAKLGPRNKVLAVPPDQTREHSRAGELTRFAWKHYGDRMKAVLPALGTHVAMNPERVAAMFGEMPFDLFKVHNWRTDIETLGEV